MFAGWGGEMMRRKLLLGYRSSSSSGKMDPRPVIHLFFGTSDDKYLVYFCSYLEFPQMAFSKIYAKDDFESTNDWQRPSATVSLCCRMLIGRTEASRPVVGRLRTILGPTSSKCRYAHGWHHYRFTGSEMNFDTLHSTSQRCCYCLRKCSALCVMRGQYNNQLDYTISLNL